MVLLLINFNIDNEVIDKLPILNGRYSDFTEDWYKVVGATLCFTLLMNTVTPHGSKIAMPMLTVFKRWRDRGYTSAFSSKDEEGKVKCNSKKHFVQSDWEAFYTGPQIPTFYIYAQFFTSMMCMMCFSSGMPILYPVAAFNYYVIYWVYKTLIIKFY